jgi:hypothetical protein
VFVSRGGAHRLCHYNVLHRVGNNCYDRNWSSFTHLHP